MTTLRFTDGMTFEIAGPLHIEERCDGWYVVGHGMLLPVESRDDAEQCIAELSAGALIKKGVSHDQ